MNLFRIIIAATSMACTSPALAVNIDLVTVGDPGNPADMRYNLGLRPEGFGRVDYVYQIGKFEVTQAQYTEFLNAVAAADPYGLYDPRMDGAVSAFSCMIKRNGSPGSYTYSVPDDWADRPVAIVSWGSAARFANWLTNGQPVGGQDLTTTESGSYLLNGAITDGSLQTVTRAPDASYVIPSEDEWYKAAYYDPGKPGGAGYWDYPTRSDDEPSNVLDPGGTNNANFYADGLTIGSPYHYTEVGALQSSPGPHGTFDQGGNVIEWNESKPEEWARGMRGGSAGPFVGGSLNMRADFSSFYFNPSGSHGAVGFRVALVPEPTSLALFCLAGLAIRRPHRRYEP